MSRTLDLSSNPLVDINTTPLVDVMLVLLIIFMITAPMLAQRLPVPMPESTEQPAAPKLDVRLELRDSGAVPTPWLDGEAMHPAEARALLQALGVREVEDQPRLLIDAEPGIAFEHVAAWMSVGQQAGLQRVGLAEVSESR